MGRSAVFLATLIAVLATVPGAGSQAGPVIISATLGGSVDDPEFILTGRSFGVLPAVSQPPTSTSACASGTGDLGLNYGNKLYFHDDTNDLSAGLSGPYGNNPNVVDCVGLLVSSFTSTRVAYKLGSLYKGNYAVNDGDAVTFVVNGAIARVTVRYGATAVNLPVCVVPRVVGKTLARAVAALKQARCSLGTATKPKKRPKRTLVVRSQRPAAGAAVSAGTRVSVMLG